MAEIDVYYTVPVCVTVDTDSGEVTRVVVDDEAVVLLPDQQNCGPRAIEIAEAVSWPAWEFGF